MLLFFAAVPQQSESVKGEVKLDQFQYHPEYKNRSSERFKELSDRFKTNVSKVLSLRQAQHNNIHSIVMTQEAKVITKPLFMITHCRAQNNF